MGDISIIARRLKDGRVQYGSYGSSGYYAGLGQSLLEWYQAPDTVEYLFRLGQLKSLGVPGSEKGGYSIYYTHELTGKPYLHGTGEQDIFRQSENIRYCYFYDLDNQWYYVVPGSFLLKIPLQLIANNLDNRGYEFAFGSAARRQLTEYLLGEYPAHDECFQKLLTDNGQEPKKLLQILLQEEEPLKRFLEYPKIGQYFDPWAVLTADAGHRNIEDFLVRPAGGTHLETHLWTQM